METEERRAAKREVVKHMLQGQPWHVAAAAAGPHVSRSTAYRLLQRSRTQGEAAFADGRHGHPTKLRVPGFSAAPFAAAVRARKLLERGKPPRSSRTPSS